MSNGNVTMESYPSSNNTQRPEVMLVGGNTGSVSNGQTATIKITPLVSGEAYTIESMFLNSIIGNACTVSIHVEIVRGEGALATNMCDSKVYAGTETFGGHIGGLTAYMPSYVTILNSSGGSLTYSFVTTISGRVSVTTSVA